MGSSKARRQPPARRQVRYPQEKRSGSRKRPYWIIWPAIVVLVTLGAFLIAREQAQGPSEAVEPPATGLPNTPDYHSLLVDPADPDRIFLGTHAGLYESTDGGRRWTFARLEGRDAMNLARSGKDKVWTAGHNVLAKSTDGGLSWSDVRPDGLPSLDVHGFAVDPSDPNRLYAAVAGEGLFRSTDGGQAFDLVSKEVGPSVFGLAVTPDGRILAADPGRGLLESDGGGKSWRVAARGGVLGVAVNPADPGTILVTGPGILRSEDGGRRWNRALAVDGVVGPVAWSPSDGRIAYAVGFPPPDLLQELGPGPSESKGTLYRTDDGGSSWQTVGQDS